MPRATTCRSAADLVAAGLAPPEALVELERVAARYAVSLTPGLGELIDRADRHDPIARQFVPDPAELDRQAEETADHLEELTNQATSEKPKPSYWNLSKEGIIDAAKAVGEVGKTAIELVAKLGTTAPPWSKVEKRSELREAEA